MKLSYNNKPYNKIDYYLLPNGLVDVFLHKNEFIETDKEGNKTHVAEEVYFQVESNITKDTIIIDFEKYWDNEGIVKVEEIELKDRMTNTEIDVVTLQETIDTIFGGM